MTIKSLFAASVADAIRQARKELGDEAILLKCRRAPREWEDLGAYEVVFGVGFETRLRSSGELSVDIEEEAAIELQASIERIPYLQDRLDKNGFDPGVAQGMLQYVRSGLTASGGLGRDDSERIADTLLVEAFRESVCLSSALGDAAARSAAALVGPPGVGKSVLAVRLAISEGLAIGRPVMVIAAPDARPGGGERLRWFCELLDVEFRQAARLSQLASWLERLPTNALTLIDTPGLGPQDMQSHDLLTTLLGLRSEIRKHLVLSACSSLEQLKASQSLFADFKPTRLAYTRLDEAQFLGPALSHAAIAAIPVSYFTTGQDVPGDLLPAEELDFAALLDAQVPAETVRAA